MKFSALFAMVVAVFTLFFGSGLASPAPAPEPRVPIGAIAKGVSTGVKLGEAWNSLRNRG